MAHILVAGALHPSGRALLEAAPHSVRYIDEITEQSYAPHIPEADALVIRTQPLSAETVARAAALCKADLVTGMVGEFPELQGIMGQYYAEHFGEAPFTTLEAVSWLREHREVAAVNERVEESADNRDQRELSRLRLVREVGRYAG